MRFKFSNILNLNSFPQLNKIKIKEKNEYLWKKIKIVQISDFHIERVDNLFIKNVIQKINKEEPDLIFFTGDLIDYKCIKEINMLKELKCKLKIFILGNREKNDLLSFRKIIKDNKWILLEDEFINLNIKGENIYVYGMNDLTINNDDDFEEIKNKYNKNVIYKNLEKIDILLCHNPGILNKYDDMFLKPRLILLGHTHKGQIYPFGLKYLKKDLRKYIGNFIFKKSFVNVSNGIGYGRIFKNKYLEKINVRFLAQNNIDVLYI